MKLAHHCLALAACTLFAAGASAQTARDIRGPAAVVPIDAEPPAKLIVDPPLPGPLAEGKAFIQYRTENLRIVPVYGKNAVDVSPRVGHLHVKVDGATWHWADASAEPILLVGLVPGPHQVLIELTDPVGKVLDEKTVKFTVPNRAR